MIEEKYAYTLHSDKHSKQLDICSYSYVPNSKNINKANTF